METVVVWPEMLVLARESRGLMSRTALARATGIAPATLAAYEEGRVPVTSAHLAIFVAVLGYPSAFFAYGNRTQARTSGCPRYRIAHRRR